MPLAKKSERVGGRGQGGRGDDFTPIFLSLWESREKFHSSEPPPPIPVPFMEEKKKGERKSDVYLLASPKI